MTWTMPVARALRSGLERWAVPAARSAASKTFRLDWCEVGGGCTQGRLSIRPLLDCTFRIMRLFACVYMDEEKQMAVDAFEFMYCGVWNERGGVQMVPLVNTRGLFHLCMPRRKPRK